MFIHGVAIGSCFPSIGWMDFDDMVKKVKIVDKRHLNVAQIDTIFKAVNYEVVDLEDNPDRDLCRYEFFEIIVRMAMAKYKDYSFTPRQAFEKMMEEHWKPYAGTSDAHNTRWSHIYTVAVNDIMEFNAANTKKLYNSLKKTPSARAVALEDLHAYVKSIHT